MSEGRLQQLLAFHKESPNDSFILFALAKEYEGNKNDEKALEYYKLLKKKDPNYVGLYYHLAKLYEETGEYELALKNYNEGIAVATKFGDHHALSELANAKLNLEMEM